MAVLLHNKTREILFTCQLGYTQYEKISATSRNQYSFYMLNTEQFNDKSTDRKTIRSNNSFVDRNVSVSSVRVFSDFHRQ